MSKNTPDFNPFASMAKPEKVSPEATGIQPELGWPSPRHARLGFFDCFFEAKEFLSKDYWLFWGLTFVGMFIMGVVPLILAGPIYCGLGFCYLAVERRQEPSFELMFKGFEEFMKSLIPTLLYFLFALLVVPLYMVGLFAGFALCATGEPVGIALGVCSIGFGVSVLFVGMTYISYGAMFACFLVAEYRLEGMDAFKVSLAGIQKNFFGLFGVMIASLIVTICAMLLCYIPLLLMFPIFTCAPFICYRKIFRPQSKSTKQRMVFPS